MPRPSSQAVLAAALSIAGLVVIGCAGGLTPPAKPMGRTEFTLSSAAFVSEYASNSNAFHTKYADRVVELTGKLSTINRDQAGQPFFMLEGPDPKKFDQAICHMAAPFPWSQAHPGQVVTLKGRGTSRYFVPRLEYCQILDATGPPLPTLTADEFARRTADPDILKGRNGYTYLIVGGEFSHFDSASGGLFLKTEAKGPGALIHFSENERKRAGVASWSPGKQIVVIGGDATNPGAKAASLMECLLMGDPK